MLQIKPRNIIPITKARIQLDDLVDDANGNNFFVISKQGKATAAIINVDYLMEMQKKIDAWEMEKMRTQMQKGFGTHLIGRGLDPDKLSDVQAEKILFSEKKK